MRKSRRPRAQASRGRFLVGGRSRAEQKRSRVRKRHEEVSSWVGATEPRNRATCASVVRSSTSVQSLFFFHAASMRSRYTARSFGASLHPIFFPPRSHSRPKLTTLFLFISLPRFSSQTLTLNLTKKK